MLRLEVLTVLCLHVSLQLFGQVESDTIWNRIDSYGKKQGYWKKYYPDSTLLYKGFFKNDIPLGEFRRFYQNGNLKALMYHYPDGINTCTKLYYKNGVLAAEGKYSNQQKDSIWHYYSIHTKTLSYTESYKKGMKDGLSIKYYPNGQIAESLQWEQGMKHGTWKQYYDDASLRLSSTYTYNKLNGDYVVYNQKGMNTIKGKYLENLPEGKWTYYNDKGEIEFELEYDKGKCLNEEILEERARKYMEEMEKNLGTIPEPDLENIVPDNK